MDQARSSSFRRALSSSIPRDCNEPPARSQKSGFCRGKKEKGEQQNIAETVEGYAAEITY
jgi:hypothetical protein